MANTQIAGHDTSQPNPEALDELISSWRRHLRAQRMSPATITTYAAAVRQLATFLRANGMPTRPASIRREHVEAWITELLDRWKPATAHNRYRGAHAFFRWLAEEGEVRDNPMARMKPPRLPEAPPPVLREAELRALFAACERDRTFVGRRDEAIVRTLADTGIRRSELLGLELDHVHLDAGAARHRQRVAHAGCRGRRPHRPGARPLPAAAREARRCSAAVALARPLPSAARVGPRRPHHPRATRPGSAAGSTPMTFGTPTHITGCPRAARSRT